MSSGVAVVPYTLTFLVVLIAPGPDFALVVRNAARSGRPAGVATAAGIASGLAVHAGLVAAGLGALIATSALAYTVVKLAGAAYLVVLGVITLASALRRRRSGDRGRPGTEDALADSTGRLTCGRAFRQGLLCNVLNPKAVLTYLALMPQFLPVAPAATSTLLLSAITVASAVGWFGLVALTVAAVRQVLQRPRVQRVLDAVTGSLLIGFGLRVATQPAR